MQGSFLLFAQNIIRNIIVKVVYGSFFHCYVYQVITVNIANDIFSVLARSLALFKICHPPPLLKRLNVPPDPQFRTTDVMGEHNHDLKNLWYLSRAA
jgi:hypothetical protein